METECSGININRFDVKMRAENILGLNPDSPTQFCKLLSSRRELWQLV